MPQIDPAQIVPTGLAAGNTFSAPDLLGYSTNDLNLLRFIQRAKELGFTLSEIKELLSLRCSERPCKDVQKRAEAKIAEIEAKVAMLLRMKEVLGRLASSCCEQNDKSRCPILETLDGDEKAGRRRNDSGSDDSSSLSGQWDQGQEGRHPDCWLPLVLLAFGVSGVGIAGALESYRLVFIVLTLGFLAAAFYFTYRPRQAASASDDCCTAPDCCGASTPSAKGRFNRMTLNKVMLWGVTLLAILFLFFPKYVGFFMAGGNGAVETNNPLIRPTTFRVEGMTCEGCSALVEKIIRDVPGVLSAKIDYDKKMATVSSEECCPAPVKPIVQALEKAGYRGEVVEESSSLQGP